MPGADALATLVYDPLLYRTPLPYQVRIYPYGFPVDVSSDAREVLDAARASFGAYAPRYDRPPLRLHVMVADGGSGSPPNRCCAANETC